jgi:uncharacterized repeat protein (TIGR01451 family)
MNLLYKHLLAAKTKPQKRYKRLLGSLVLSLLALSSWSQTAQAEGSRNLYPNGAPGSRANIEWRTSLYGNLVRRRTLLKVFAKQGEYIFMGSSAVNIRPNVGSSNVGDIRIFAPGAVTGSVGQENIPFNTAGQELFRCRDTNSANITPATANPRGRITSRDQELAGPQYLNAVGTPVGNLGGYLPCYFQAPQTGVYDVVINGPLGAGSDNDGNATSITGDINLTSISNFDLTQGSTVAAWDVTVRSSLDSTVDLNGRLFAYYLALFAGANGRSLFFPIYPVTLDGYRYRVTLRGLDPAGFIIYGNQAGFFDNDGTTPLYHDVIGNNNNLDTRDGNVQLSSPQFPTFFNQVDPDALNFITRYRPNGTPDGTGIPSIPTRPLVSGLSFQGTASGNNSAFRTGGTFTFNSNIPGTYEIVISRDGVNFDPTNPQNRVLRGLMASSGSQTVNWNGRNNIVNPGNLNDPANFFPVGQNYQVRVKIHAGEYHFPLLDAENNTSGGPTIELLNETNPLGNFTAFYDDRGYVTANGTQVQTPGQVICGTNPPNPSFSDPINGFDTRNNNRAYGVTGNAGSTGTRCSGAFGDTKGLDIWTYYPSATNTTLLNIVNAASMRLVKRITRINNQDINDILDGSSAVPLDDPRFVAAPRDLDDDDAKWPASYLRGVINTNTVKPGDEIEYTIYFLSNGQSEVSNIKFCDLVPDNTTFLPTAFNGLTPNDGGSGTDQGIALAVGSTTPTVYFSNTADSDRATFYPANDPATPTYCGTNTNGAVVVEITRNPVLPNIPPATGSGTPSNSYGFVRFRATVR